MKQILTLSYWTDPLSETFAKRFWTAFAILIVITVFMAGTFWISDHPYPADYDEAFYIDAAYYTNNFFRTGGLPELARTIFKDDRSRPPAYRVLMLPLTIPLGINSVAMLRLISLSFWVGSLILIYLTGKQLAGQAAGAFAIILLALSPVIIGSSMRFYTEYSLYLAISMMLYFLFRGWNDNRQTAFNWIGLGLALGLGAWTKLSFAFIAGPILVLALFMSWRKVIVGPGFKFLVKAMGLGIILAIPWWLLNFRPALGYARYAGQFAQSSLGDSFLDKLVMWLIAYAYAAIGPALTILLVMILLTLVFKRFVKQNTKMNTTQVIALWICGAGIFPLMFLQLSSLNQNIRLIAPTLIPLAIGVGIIAATNQWTRSRLLILIVSAVFSYQLFVTVVPIRIIPIHEDPEAIIDRARVTTYELNPALVMLRAPQWDWGPLRETSRLLSTQNPSIAYLGCGPAFDTYQILFPWAKQGEHVHIRQLWRFGEGEVNWETLLESLDDNNIVVTAPGYKPSQSDNDNQYNTELASRLQKDPRFLEPLKLKMGQFAPVEIFVFLRKPGNGQ